MSVAQNGRQTICAVRCGGTLYGVPAVSVREVLEWRPPTSVPLAPGYVAGLIVHHGDVLTVIRLSSLLDASEAPSTAFLVVLEDPTTAERFALTVDCVEQVLAVSLSELRPNSPAVSPLLQSLFSGVSPACSEPLILLNVSSLTPDSLFQNFGRRPKANREGKPCVP